MQENSLGGLIPTELGNAEEIDTYVNLHGNSLTGLIPTQLGRVTGVGMLALDVNSLTGYFPSELGLLTGAQFALSRNSINGTIPTEFGNRSAAESRFELYSNQLTGSVPTELGLMVALTQGIYLFDNSLDGAVPTELGQLADMWGHVNVVRNSLRGQLPTQLGKLTEMRVNLKISENSLTSTIPTEAGLLTKLTNVFSLKSNTLTGSLPSELGLMTGLTAYFKLDSNRLCDDVPTELAALSDTFPSATPSAAPSYWDVTTDTFVGPTPCPAVSALVALYESTGGSSGGWTTAPNWMTRDPCANSWYGVTNCNCSAWAVPTVEKYILQSTVSGEAEVPTVAEFLALVQGMWGLNDDANCESPWFIWETIDPSDNSEAFSDVRVCFNTDYASWAAGHTGNNPTAITSNSYWEVMIPTEGISSTFSGQMKKAVMYGDSKNDNDEQFGLHYKRTIQAC
jgi:hypothetical protein